jgi:hypothetical protein
MSENNMAGTAKIWITFRTDGSAREVALSATRAADALDTISGVNGLSEDDEENDACVDIAVTGNLECVVEACSRLHAADLSGWVVDVYDEKNASVFEALGFEVCLED